MRIGLIDVDGHHFPNIPLMKLSAWHKAQGDSVEWYEPLLSGHMDRVYMSKIFSFTPDYQYYVDADEVIRGGSGYCIDLCDRGGNRMTIPKTTISLMRSSISTLITDCIRSLRRIRHTVS